MKKIIIITVWGMMSVLSLYAQTERDIICKENYRTLFGGEALTGEGTDPELMDILQKFIFGEVFRTGELDMKQRELITCVCLASMQTLPQLEAHAGAALNVGATSVELREAIYQCSPFIGFPRVLNAIGTVNKVFQSRGISLPLEPQGTVSEKDRRTEGAKMQAYLYGNEIKEYMDTLPQDMNDTVKNFLTEMCFGDFYTRKGLEVKARELLSLCVLATIGAEKQLATQVTGCLKAGHSKEVLYAAMIQCLSYIGFPNALTAIAIIKDA